jgi:Ras GTPase-activating-like protein IQGAP2/3
VWHICEGLSIYFESDLELNFLYHFGSSGRSLFLLQHYSNLFFLLQTTPEYLAKLTRSVSLNQIDGMPNGHCLDWCVAIVHSLINSGLLEAVMFSVYGNQYEHREEHLLLSMFEAALKYEFQEATEFTSLLRANTAITRMMTTYTRWHIHPF